MKRLWILVLVALVLTGCSILQKSCPDQSKDFVKGLDDIGARWDDANSIASSTSRIALGPAVADLQAIKRDLDNLEPPECAKQAQIQLSSYMDFSIKGYLAFMADEDDSQITRYFENAKFYMENFGIEYAKIAQDE